MKRNNKSVTIPIERNDIKMIDMDTAKKEFIKYSEKFDLENPHIKRKQLHSLRVMDISSKIVQNMDISVEEKEIATLIGLLHDIARFEQFTKYGTFRDRESIDHGDYGVEILQKDNYIKKYINDASYEDVIFKAIKNHNKYQIDKNLTEKQKLFCKVIRDADKIDILYEATEIFYTAKEIEEMNNSTIADEILSRIYNKETINRNEIKGKAKIIDLFVILAFLFDINYKTSFEIIYTQKYIDKIYKRFDFKDEDTKTKMQEIQNFLNQYMKEKIYEKE